MVKSTKPSSGVSLIGVVQVVLIVLKLCGVIAWPWVKVLVPLWIDLAIIFVVAFISAVITVMQQQ